MKPGIKSKLTPRERHLRDNEIKKKWRERNMDRQREWERLCYIRRTADKKLARIEKFEGKIQRLQARIDYLKQQLMEAGIK